MQVILELMSQMPAMQLWCIQLFLCYAGLLLMLRLFGRHGVMIMMGVMVIAANIQVLKSVMLPLYSQPLPLGTTFMATNYLASDLLNEYFGPKVAKKAVVMAIAAFVIMSVCMLLTLGFKPLTAGQAHAAGVINALDIQRALHVLFTPAPILLGCSLLSFWITQRVEIAIFTAIKKRTGQKALWLRNNISTWIAALLDNVIFNLLVWRLFSQHPIAWPTLIMGYIFGTYSLRVFMALIDTPFMYLAKYAVKDLSLVS